MSTFYERVVEMHGFKYIKLKSGRFITFWDALKSAERSETGLVRAVSRALKLARDDDDDDLERLEWLIEGLEAWVASVTAEIQKRRGIHSKEERIALLRNTRGRTPEEAKEFRRKADELERRLKVGGR